MAQNQDNADDQQFAAIPAHATERLVEMRGRDEANRLFTSDLSTSELLLVKEAGGRVGDLAGGSEFLRSHEVIAAAPGLFNSLREAILAARRT